MSIVGWPDDEAGRLRGSVSVPGLLSFLVHDNLSEPVLGLNEFRPEHRPRTLIPFFSYRVMIASGVFFILLTLYACWRLVRGTLYQSRGLLWVFVLAVIPAVAANQTGWISAEVGRQPWIVHPPIQRTAEGQIVRDDEGYVQYERTETPDGTTRVAGLRTTDGVSTAIGSQQVARSIVMFGLLYTLLGALWVYVLHNKIQQGPEPISAEKKGKRGFLDVAAEQFDAKLSAGDTEKTDS
jgi:cytochrome d ubiquinol oxidase subunit I